MATSSHQLTDDYTCAYCFQKLPRMADPRELPCTHIFCFPCLKDDFTDVGMTRCKICRQTHDIENIQDLPKVNLPSCSVNSKDEQPCAALCDVCTESRELATVFCSDCSKSFCKEHAQMHTLLHGEEHEITLVQSKLSQTQTCQEHPENILTLACRACHSMFCSSCSTESDCESSSEMDDKKHAIVGVNLFAEELRQMMRTESMDIADRIELVCCAEKSIPNNLTEAENKVSQLTRVVDMAANKKILDIQNKTASAKDKLKFFSKSAKKETLTRSKELKRKREQLQSLLQFIHRASSNSAHSVVAAQRELSAMLKESDISSVIRSHIKYSSNALNQNENVSDQDATHFLILSPPNTLNFVTSATAASQILWNSKEQLVSVHEASVRVYDRDLVHLQSYTPSGHVLSLIQSNKQAHLRACPEYLAWIRKQCRDENVGVAQPAYSEPSRNVRVPHFTTLFSEPPSARASLQESYTVQLVRCDKVFKMMQQLDSRPFSSQSIKVVINSQTSNIHILDTNGFDTFSLNGDLLGTYTLKNITSPQEITVSSDGGILLLGTDRLYKYQQPLPSKTMTLLWKSDTLANPSGICVGSDEYIYVGRPGDLYVLSPFGNILKVLTHQYLRSVNISDIAVSPSAEQIAIACGDNGLKLFNLCRA